MIKSAVDVYLGTEKMSIDRSEFETSEDLMKRFEESDHVVSDEIEQNVIENNGMDNISIKVNCSDKEPFYFAATANGQEFRSNRHRMQSLSQFVTKNLKNVGYNNNNINFLGVTGLRKNFAIDVNKAPIDINQVILLNILMSNTDRTRLKSYSNAGIQREKFGANIFQTGVDAESVKYFLEKTNKAYALFNDREMHNKDNFPVNLTPLDDPLEFLKKQCPEPFKMKKCPFVGCGKEFKYLPMLREHIRNECQGSDKYIDTDGKEKKCKIGAKQELCTAIYNPKKFLYTICSTSYISSDTHRKHYHVYHPSIVYNDIIKDQSQTYKCPVAFCEKWSRTINEVSLAIIKIVLKKRNRL